LHFLKITCSYTYALKHSTGGFNLNIQPHQKPTMIGPQKVCWRNVTIQVQMQGFQAMQNFIFQMTLCWFHGIMHTMRS